MSINTGDYNAMSGFDVNDSAIGFGVRILVYFSVRNTMISNIILKI